MSGKGINLAAEALVDGEKVRQLTPLLDLPHNLNEAAVAPFHGVFGGLGSAGEGDDGGFVAGIFDDGGEVLHQLGHDGVHRLNLQQTVDAEASVLFAKLLVDATQVGERVLNLSAMIEGDDEAEDRLGTFGTGIAQGEFTNQAGTFFERKIHHCRPAIGAVFDGGIPGLEGKHGGDVAALLGFDHVAGKTLGGPGSVRFEIAATKRHQRDVTVDIVTNQTTDKFGKGFCEGQKPKRRDDVEDQVPHRQGTLWAQIQTLERARPKGVKKGRKAAAPRTL